MKKLFLLLLISLSTFAQKSIPFGNNPQAGHYATIRGFQMYYEIYGKGEPLLFIHGNNGSIQDLKIKFPLLANATVLLSQIIALRENRLIRKIP